MCPSRTWELNAPTGLFGEPGSSIENATAGRGRFLFTCSDWMENRPWACHVQLPQAWEFLHLWLMSFRTAFSSELLFPQFSYARKIPKELWYPPSMGHFLNASIKAYLQRSCSVFSMWIIDLLQLTKEHLSFQNNQYRHTSSQDEHRGTWLIAAIKLKCLADYLVFQNSLWITALFWWLQF